MSNFAPTHQRHHTSFLAAPEGRLLRLMAGLLPGRVQPDHLTLLGLAAMLLAGLAYGLTSLDRSFLHLVNFFLFLNWLGDSLDGTLARYRDKLRPRYGFYVDHVIDSVGAFFLLGGMSLSGLMSERMALGLLVAYLMLSIDSYLAAHALGRFRISYFKLSPTELRLLLIAGNLVVLHKTHVVLAGRSFLLFDVAGGGAAVLIGFTFLFSAARNTWRLYQLERV